MQLTCSTDSVIQFLERLYPASTGEINCSWRGRERESGRRKEKGVSLAAVDGIQGCSLEEYKEWGRGKEEEEGYLSSAGGFFHGAARYPRITLPLLIAKYPESPRSSSN